MLVKVDERLYRHGLYDDMFIVKYENRNANTNDKIDITTDEAHELLKEYENAPGITWSSHLLTGHIIYITYEKTHENK